MAPVMLGSVVTVMPGTIGAEVQEWEQQVVA
jgi:hypothetical protein